MRLRPTQNLQQPLYVAHVVVDRGRHSDLVPGQRNVNPCFAQRSACREARWRFVLWIRRTRRETMRKKVAITRVRLDGVMQARPEPPYEPRAMRKLMLSMHLSLDGFVGG